jgi:hypothetical protein
MDLMLRTCPHHGAPFHARSAPNATKDTGGVAAGVLLLVR